MFSADNMCRKLVPALSVGIT